MKLLIVAFITAFLLGMVYFYPSSLVLAQDQNIQTVESTQTTGEIIKKENSILTVQTENQIQELQVPSNVKITKNGTEASLNELQTGDDVVVTHSQSGEILSVEAISGEILDWGTWLVPGILGLILLAGLIYLIRKRMNKGYIQTSTNTR